MVEDEETGHYVFRAGSICTAGELALYTAAAI